MKIFAVRIGNRYGPEYEKYLEDKKADSICIVKYNGNNDHEPVEVPPVDNGQRNVTKMQEEIGSDNVIQYISCVLKNKRGNKHKAWKEENPSLKADMKGAIVRVQFRLGDLEEKTR